MLPSYAPAQAALIRLAMAGQLPAGRGFGGGMNAQSPPSPIDGGYDWRRRGFPGMEQNLPFHGIDPAIALAMQGQQGQQPQQPYTAYNPMYHQLSGGAPHPIGPAGHHSIGPLPLSANTQGMGAQANSQAGQHIQRVTDIHGAVQQLAQRMSQGIKKPMAARLGR